MSHLQFAGRANRIENFKGSRQKRSGCAKRVFSRRIVGHLIADAVNDKFDDPVDLP
jgi:hypothetical protein